MPISDPIPDVVRAVLDLTKPRWAVHILTGLADGGRRYTDLQQLINQHLANVGNDDPLHNPTFTAALKKLTANGLIERTSGPKNAQLYRLTRQGQELVGLLHEVYQWGTRHAVALGLQQPPRD